MAMVESPAPATALGQNARLGERLIEAGVLTDPQLALAMREQKRKGRLLSNNIVVDLGLAPPQVISGFVADEAHAKSDWVEADSTVCHQFTDV